LLEGLTGFTIILVVSIAVALVIMAIGNDLAPKSPDTPGKLAPYACGEDIAPTKVRVNVENFFIYAVYFMIFDVLGFVLATTRPGERDAAAAHAAAPSVHRYMTAK
jgi:NADH:ubiquinone oxidoreductase subunit 3 (subunit A)